MIRPQVSIRNGYQNTPPTIRIFDLDSGEEFRMDKQELETIIENTLKKNKYQIEAIFGKRKYRRIKIIN